MSGSKPIKVAIACVSVLSTLVLMRTCGQEKSMDSHHTSKWHGEPPSRNANSDISRRTDHFCVEWDQDTFDIDEWWTHHPEFVIERQNTTHQCFQREVSSEKSHFFTEVYRNQFHNECDVILARYLKSSGWGADFNALGHGLLLALSEKKPMFFIPNPKKPKMQVWQYAANEDGSAATCSSKDIHCYFLPITKCKTNRTQAYEVDTKTHVRDKKTWPWAYQYLTRGQQWIRRAVTDFVEDQRPAFPPNETCTVIHVRRGDVVLQKRIPRNKLSRGYHPISAYLDLLPNERRQPGSNILLLTDDANAIDETQEFHSEINWHWFNRSRHRGREGKFMSHIVAPTPKDDVVAILGTFEIAKQCDAVVRGVSSFGDMILDQVMDAWKEKGKDIISRQVLEEFTNNQDRMNSDKSLEKTLEKMRADKRASPEPSGTVDKRDDLVGDASAQDCIVVSAT